MGKSKVKSTQIVWRSQGFQNQEKDNFTKDNSSILYLFKKTFSTDSLVSLITKQTTPFKELCFGFSVFKNCSYI